MTKEISEFFPINLRRELKRVGMTRYRLAKTIGISESSLYDYVNARNLPSVETLIKIKNALDTSYEALLKSNNC